MSDPSATTDPFADDLPFTAPQTAITLCEFEGCTHPGFPCVYSLADPEEEPEILCGEHAAQAGFCAGCGYASAGQSGFDFLHPGLCDNCHSENRDDEENDEDGYDYDPAYGTYR